MTLLGLELMRRLAAALAPISGIGYCDPSQTAGSSTPPGDVDLDAVARAIQARAASNDLNVSIEQLRLPEPALRVVVHLQERQLFTRISSWRSMVLPPEADPVSRLLRVENPHGVAVLVESWARSDVADRGLLRGNPDGDASRLAVPNAPVPPWLRRGTRLSIRYLVTPDGRPNSPRPGLRRFRIRCGAHPTGIPHPRRVCETILRDRWALFVPQQLGSEEAGFDQPCFGGVFDTVTITGTIGGRRIERSYFCELATTYRWAVLLGARPPG